MLGEISPICRFTKICHWTVTSVTYICLQKFPTWFGDFPKSATVQLPKLLICACRNSPPVCRFSEICHWTVTLVTFLKSSNGQSPKLPTSACRNPPSLQIFQNLPLDRSPKLPTCACRNSPPEFADFLKSATGQLPKLNTCACLNSPPCSWIFWNMPLDSYLSYLHVLAEIPLPQFADFLKSATEQLPRLHSWNLTMDSYVSYLHVLAVMPP